MKSSFWFLLLFSGASLLGAFAAMDEAQMALAFILVASIASSCAKAVYEIHAGIDRIEKKNEIDRESDANAEPQQAGRAESRP